MKPIVLPAAFLLACALEAGVGDPQIKTDHPFYPGELAVSSFERLFQEQAEQYRAATGNEVQSEQDKVLASWFWRNTHYAHGEEGAENLWGRGFAAGDLRTREYWTGLFAHGFGLCGTTHSQWTAEMEHLLGHGRGRGVGVNAHNSFEVFMREGPYAPGKWVLVDHDISTIIFDSSGKSLLSIREIKENPTQFTNQKASAQKQNGWVVCGLHPEDGAVFNEYNTAEYLAGYAGVPPMVHLRRGESLRRYLEPGLEDGATFVFWGRNYMTEGIPGPERSLTWVNQPEKMHGAQGSAPYKPGQARFGNAVYVYEPDFSNGDYREGVIDEGPEHVTLEFYSPYIIAATPRDKGPWGIYEPGCRNGLVLKGAGGFTVSVSVDQGTTWSEPATLRQELDLTDHVKGYRQYWLQLGASARSLAERPLTITTVCQANPAILPRLKEGENQVTFAASGRAVISAGPTKAQAEARVISGSFDSPEVTLELRAPRGNPVLEVHGAAHTASGNPPDPKVQYQIEYSVDGGASWKAIVQNWNVPRQGDEPPDFWSQSFCYGRARLEEPARQPIQVRFRNNGRRNILRAEAHLVYQTPRTDPVRVNFCWKNAGGEQQAQHVFRDGEQQGIWRLQAGKDVQTRWVEFAPVP